LNKLKKNLTNTVGLHPLPDAIFKNYRATKSLKTNCFCSAPFVSMRIGLEGSVYACNHNSSFLLGKFPEQSLLEIWNGKPIKKLRRLLQHNDFSLGCVMCREDAINERFDAASFTLFDKYKPDKWPAMLDFRLSNACNLQCIMCSGLSSSQFFQQNEPTENVFDETFLNQLDAFIPHLDTARFIGGEPFAIPVYYKIWERIVQINPECNIIVQTNATILNDRIRQLAAKGKFHFSVSLDSLDKGTYESIRCKADFNQVMDHIEYFANYAADSHRDFVICFCPMRINYREIPAFMDFSNEKGALICLNRFLYPAHLAVWSLKAEEISEIFDSLSPYQPAENTTASAKNAAFFRDYLNLLQQWIDQAEQRKSQSISKDEVSALTIPLLKLAGDRKELFLKVKKIADFPNLIQLFWYLKPIQGYYNPQLFFDFLDTSDINKVLDDIKAVQV
jgi:MoaA/NifB/PqqE/SkfB family radical SAM enzyme